MNCASEEGSCTPKKIKIKLDIEESDDSLTDDFFADFRILNILSENAKQKCLFVHGRFGDKPDDAVLLLEKTPFCPSFVYDLLQNNVSVKVRLKNDIYKTLELYPSVPYNGNRSCLSCYLKVCDNGYRSVFMREQPIGTSEHQK